MKICRYSNGNNQGWKSSLKLFRSTAIAVPKRIVRKVAKRKETKKELERSLSLLAATLESTADGILVVDQNGKFTKYNKKFINLWNLPESILNYGDDNQALEYVVAQVKDPDGFLKKIRQLYSTPYAESFDVLEFKDARVVERYSQPQLISGKPVGRVWSFRDITEKMKSERALQDTTAHLSLIYNSASDLMALVQVEPDGVFRLISSNDAWQRRSGRCRDQLIGKPLSESLTPSEYERVRVKYLDSIAARGTVVWEGTYLNPKGLLTVETSSTPIFDSNGNCTHILAVSRDISYKKKERRRQEFLVKMGSPHSLDLAATLRTISNLIVPELSDCYSVDVLDRENKLQCLELIHRDFDEEKLALARALKQKYPYDLNIETGVPLILRTGQAKIYSAPSRLELEKIFPNQGCLELLSQMTVTAVMLVPLRVNDKTIGVMSFVASASDFQFSEDDLNLAEELSYRAALAIDNARLYSEAQRAIQVREDFMAIASHELRTPLTPLKLQLQLLLSFLNNGVFTPSKLKNLTQLIEASDKQILRLSRLIEDLLEGSRISTGHMNLNLQTVHLSNLVEEVVQQFLPELKAAKCDLELNLDRHVVGQWDWLRIEQIVGNLLSNAIKYGAGHPIRITVEARGPCARLLVQDFGVGIAKEDHSRIFERFERAVSIKRFGGLGMGLYLARQIIESHGGTISVESELKKGATFSVELP